jgi:AcrR family transcriptional regulator
MAKPSTRDRILAVATDWFGARGVDAVSLDAIANDVGVTKQTLLYWFASKDDLVQAVLESAVSELAVSVEAAIRASTDEPLECIDAVVCAVFRHAVRRPALLGLVRETNRLAPVHADRLTATIRPLADRAVRYLDAEMSNGRLRRADARLVAALCYATVAGAATEPDALRAVGWSPSTVELRRLRNELRGFLRAALRP